MVRIPDGPPPSRRDRRRPGGPSRCDVCAPSVEHAGPVPDFVVCEDCVRRDITAAGGLDVALDSPIVGARVDLGEIVVTARAGQVLTSGGTTPRSLLERHARGDWPEPVYDDEDDDEAEDDDEDDDEAEDDDEDTLAAVNAMVLRSGAGVVHGVYFTGRGDEVWVMTQLDPRTRPRTTILLPGER